MIEINSGGNIFPPVYQFFPIILTRRISPFLSNSLGQLFCPPRLEISHYGSKDGCTYIHTHTCLCLHIYIHIYISVHFTSIALVQVVYNWPLNSPGNPLCSPPLNTNYVFISYYWEQKFKLGQIGVEWR